MAQPSVYSPEFFADYRGASTASADAVVPLVLKLIEPKSVVDVGCGIGTWLSVFRKHGVSQTLGIDGQHVDPDQLEIPGECFMSQDLEALVPLNRQYDLAVSLEVAEHLTDGASRILIAELCRLSDVVLFSAAIPHQGGDHHINEKWQSEWAKMFAQHGYSPLDCIRPLVWSEPSVAYYYAQNALLYVRTDRLAHYPRLLEYSQQSLPPILDIVHPAKWAESRTARGVGFSFLVRSLPFAAGRSAWALARRVLGIKRRLGTNWPSP